ncbi:MULTISPECIES: S-layer homology domain-containing protein [unclassified Fusibacter]|uniref:S-layer homology domain-containing protein n=1 Tax=unclassified Fusibacter TaxID=2624464 RepID=UPI001012FF07|nr:MULTISPECIES: S-layer homology domain-containing protein [unclassified Fusibacter]MCK8061246.1 S-layer homology domain-containing protein [Fusibacter sp. A2]NPE23410.1 protease complex subunit PrcB family protein [Fusibacter sp. A1]RXV59189.1 protease complex subunit PrcB family protein [Fusibacter sp. A1]
MKRTISLLLVIIMVIMNVYASPIEKFTDIDNHWAKTEIEYLVSNKIISGVSETKIAPDQDLKYAEWQIMIDRMMQFNKETAWQDKIITREQAMQMLYEQAENKNITWTDKIVYRDEDKIDSSYVTAVYWATELGLVKGGLNGDFMPKKTLTRAEGMVIMYRHIKASLVNKETTTDLSKFKTKLESISDSDYQITLTWGPHSTGGYSVVINDVVVNSGVITLNVSTYSPKADEVVTQAISTATAKIIVSKEGIDATSPININVIN